MTMIHFEKVEGLGNHFVLIDETRAQCEDWPSLARAVCAEGTGVGADGLLVVAPPSDAGVLRAMRMYNPDGTEDMCGNGLRCIAHVAVADYAEDAGRAVRIETIAGTREARVWDAGSVEATVRTSLGSPRLNPEDMPAEFSGESVLGEELAVGGRALRVCLVSMGTPHCVIFGPHPTEAIFRELSPMIEEHPRFPERISVMWAEEVSSHELSLRIWERAAGETLACGTGAAASAVAGILTGRVESPVAVSMPGGALTIEWLGPDAEVYQVGQSRRVYTGRWFVYD